MTSIIISGHAKSQAESYAQKLVQHNFSSKNIIILGPVEAPIFLLRGQHRYRILIKGSSRKILNESFAKPYFVTGNVLKDSSSSPSNSPYS